MKRVLLLTGSTGIGKTTVLIKTINFLKEKGYCVGGMISREVREGRTRIGFEILDLSSQKHGWLAHVNQKNGPMLVKYRVNLEDLENVGVSLNAVTQQVLDEGVVKFEQAFDQLLSNRQLNLNHLIMV